MQEIKMGNSRNKNGEIPFNAGQRQGDVELPSMKGLKLCKELKPGKTFRKLSPAESTRGLCKSQRGKSENPSSNSNPAVESDIFTS